MPFKIVRFDSIPVTTPARALIDSSSVLPFDLLRRAVREALALRRVTIKELIATPGQRHRNLNEIIADGYVPTRNEFEDAVLDLIAEGGFARARRQQAGSSSAASARNRTSAGPSSGS